MMTSYNQRLAIVIINAEGFKDLQTDLHDWKLFSKAYSEPGQAPEMTLFEKIVNSFQLYSLQLSFFQKAPSCVFDWVLHTPLVL